MGVEDKGMSTAILRTATEVKQYRVWKRILGLIAGILAIMLTLIYIASALYTTSGSFTVQINKVDNANYSMVLSDTLSFTQTAVKLDARASKEVTNICYIDVLSTLKDIDGSHNGENYVATTFYLRNDGNKVLSYSYEMYIENITKDLDQAVRIMVVIDDTETNIYSRWNSSTDIDYVCPFSRDTMELYGPTKNFVSDSVVFTGTKDGLRPYAATGDYTKFTVVIWIEGDDPECVDNKIGGEFRVDMLFSVAQAEDFNG